MRMRVSMKYVEMRLVVPRQDLYSRPMMMDRWHSVAYVTNITA
jgi:hypothetical protein